MKNPKISIIDYGVGNLHSVFKACRIFADRVSITEEAAEIASSDAIILPGVGSFEAGMAGLAVRNLTENVIAFAKTGKPILGICLGTQLFLTKGYEFGEWNGLDLVSGSVIRFPEHTSARIPHIGWASLSETPRTSHLLQGIPPGAHVYFVHSYILDPKDIEVTVATSRHGTIEFPAIIQKENLYGCQFHPEKSGEVGLSIIKNFINHI